MPKHHSPTALAAAATLAAACCGLATPAHAAEAPPVVDVPSTAFSADMLPTAQIDNIAWDSVIVGDTVYVGGEFTSTRPAGAAKGTSESPRQNLMSYSLSTGKATTWAPKVNGRIRVMATSPDGSRLYIGGSFTTVDGKPRAHLAAFDTSDGSLVEDFAPNIGNDVTALTVGQDAVYIGGWFGSVNGVGRTRLAALTPEGATTQWAPTADQTPESMALTEDEDRVILGGSFANINGSRARSLASVDAEDGTLYPFAANEVVDNSAVGVKAGAGSGFKSLRVSGDTVYAVGWSYQSGNFEGMLTADARTGDIRTIAPCKGDSYDVEPRDDLVFMVSHHHNCSAIGAFPEQSKRAYQHSDAVTSQAAGTVQGNDFGGLPAPSYVAWQPSWTPNTSDAGSHASQAGWSVETSGSYLAIAGEFLAVNGTKQQGLVRFATRDHATNKQGPMTTDEELTPALSSSHSVVDGTVKMPWDRDQLRTTVRILRSDRKTPVATITRNSPWWNRPTAGFTDTTVTAGSTYTYRVEAVDASGNTRTGPAVSVEVPSSADASGTSKQGARR